FFLLLLLLLGQQFTQLAGFTVPALELEPQLLAFLLRVFAIGLLRDQLSQLLHVTAALVIGLDRADRLVALRARLLDVRRRRLGQGRRRRARGGEPREMLARLAAHPLGLLA